MTVVVGICLAGLAVAAAMCLLRLVRGPSVPDRIVALDALLFVVVAGIAVGSVIGGGGDFLTVLVAVSLLGFVGTVTVARFVERRGGVVSAVLDVLSSVLLLAGVALSLIAGIGLLRFPDVFSRMHAATKPATLGLLCVVLGAALQMDDGSDAVKLLLVGAFQFLTAPVAAHMIGRAAYRSGTGDLDDLVVDELKDAG